MANCASLQVRTAIQIAIITAVTLLGILFLDNRFRVLPDAIHEHLPQHHPGLVITDITLTKCSTLNVFSSCKIEGDNWHRIEKDLYLGSRWFSSAYVHIQRKREDELLLDDRVI